MLTFESVSNQVSITERRDVSLSFRQAATRAAKRLTENELSDFSLLCEDGCGKAIIEAQYVDRNHSTEI
jgi:hypothetical protein